MRPGRMQPKEIGVFYKHVFVILFYQRTHEMRTFHVAITAAILAMGATAIMAQEQSTSANASPSQTVIDRDRPCSGGSEICISLLLEG